MNKVEVLQRIRRNFPKEHRSSRYIKLPGSIKFILIDDSTVKLVLSEGCITANMQLNKAAFEGWAFVMKRWGAFDNVILDWNRQKIDKGKPEYGHYQRFLFRLFNFSRDFQSWFSISSNCLAFLEDLEIKDNTTYYLNHPSKDRCGKEPRGKESKLEYQYVCKEWSGYLKDKLNADFLDRQLPVGVFKTSTDILKKSVSIDNAIFSRGKSAIDIWGISTKEELLLLELKSDGNHTIGIISELYFYCCVMQCVQKGQFKYEQNDIPNIYRIANSEKIKAYFFVPDLHPLIDRTFVTELDSGTIPDVEFHYLKFPKPGGLPLKQVY